VSLCWFVCCVTVGDLFVCLCYVIAECFCMFVCFVSAGNLCVFVLVLCFV
jgi:hypothetical protein